MEIDEIIDEISKYNCDLVEVTGGEPLMQDGTLELMEKLCENNYTVLLETGGSLSIEKVDPRVKVILDLKCPSSNMLKKNYYENISFLKPTDEVKFVIGNREDYDWSKDLIEKYKLTEKCQVLFSTVFEVLDNRTLVEWILNDSLEVRFQTQLHKYIWEPDKKGV